MLYFETMQKHYFFQYLLLSIIVILGVTFFYRFAGLPNMQMLVITVTAAAYVGWGYLHHSIEGDLHTRVMIEYLLIAALSVILTRGAIIR